MKYNTDRKYIIIPEYAPLYAMHYCWGPTTGPLTKPTPTPVDVIGHLLKQSGQEKVTIYEVVKLSSGEFSKPVQLTLENYKLPYEVITSGDLVEHPETPKPVQVEPDIIKDEPHMDEFPVIDEAEADKNFNDPCDTVRTAFGEDHVINEDVADTPADTNDTNEEVKSEAAAPVASNPYAGMTKAERKAARRREAEQRAEKIAAEELQKESK